MYLFPAFTTAFEIVIIAVIINYLLSFFWNTRSLDLFLGLIGFLVMTFASSWFNLPILQKIIYTMTNVAIIGFLVLFQPELRLALSKFSIKGKNQKKTSDYDKFLDQLTSSVFRLAEKQHGALIVIENKDSIFDFTKSSVMMNAQFSSELLETIFSSSTPLHDGAVLIRDKMIVAAGAILPLADDQVQLYRAMGTRHRAAIGASLQCDAIVIVISEETGKASIARDGVITRGIKPDRFISILRSIFLPDEQSRKRFNTFNLLDWLRQ